MYLVKDFYEQHKEDLGITLISGDLGLSRKILKAEVQRPGLSLSGYLKHFVARRIFVFGKVEVQYLQDLKSKQRFERLRAILLEGTPMVIVGCRKKPPSELVQLCHQNQIPLFRSSLGAPILVNRVFLILNEAFSAKTTLHGTLVEIFGIGVLIQGESSVGKSEAALGLLERGHRLISDDIVKVKKKEGKFLEGSSPELTRHLMEIQGIGIINVAHLHGAVCVRPDIGIDLVVQIEPWDNQHFYDRVGFEEKFLDILGVKVPFHVLPVKQGRDVVLLMETLALNHRLKGMGYHSAKEFNVKLLEAINLRKKKGKK